MKLPKRAFLKISEGTNSDFWLAADSTLRSLMSDDDGPTRVGVYELKQIISAEKALQFKPLKKVS